MKYENTSDTNIKRNPTSKIYYFVRGSIEHSLKTKEWTKAVWRKKLKESELDSAGEVALKFTVDQVYEDYIHARRKQALGKNQKLKKIRPGTLREIEYIFKNHLLPFFGKKKLAQVNPVLWHAYCEQCTASDLKNHRKVFNGFFKWTKKRGNILALPDITEIPYHRRRKRRIITPIELEAIFENARGSLLVFLSLALYNGLRRSEIMTLQWAGVDLEKCYITVNPEFNKLDRGRSIPINKVVARLLERRWQEAPDGKWVFPNANNSSKHADIGGLKTAWGTCLFKAKLSGITWHDFRATFEKHMNKSIEHTDMQKEKFADASMDVQKNIYVSMDHEDLRGLENSVKLPAIEKIIRGKGLPSGKSGGKK